MFIIVFRRFFYPLFCVTINSSQYALKVHSFIFLKLSSWHLLYLLIKIDLILSVRSVLTTAASCQTAWLRAFVLQYSLIEIQLYRSPYRYTQRTDPVYQSISLRSSQNSDLLRIGSVSLAWAACSHAAEPQSRRCPRWNPGHRPLPRRALRPRPRAAIDSHRPAPQPPRRPLWSLSG